MNKEDVSHKSCPYCEQVFIVRGKEARQAWRQHRARCERKATQEAKQEAAALTQNTEKFIEALEDPDRTDPLYVCGNCFFSQVSKERPPDECPECEHGHMNDGEMFAAILSGAFCESVS